MLRKNSLRLSHKPSFAARIFYYAHGSVIGRPNSPKTKNKTKLTNNQHGQHCPKLVASEIIKLLKQQMREMARQSLLQAKIRTKELHVIELARWGKYTKTATWGKYTKIATAYVITGGKTLEKPPLLLDEKPTRPKQSQTKNNNKKDNEK
jgi:hypothetical protein